MSLHHTAQRGLEFLAQHKGADLFLEYLKKRNVIRLYAGSCSLTVPAFINICTLYGIAIQVRDDKEKLHGLNPELPSLLFIVPDHIQILIENASIKDGEVVFS